MLIIFDLDDTLIDTSANLTPIVLENTLRILIKHGLYVEDEALAYNHLIQINKKSLSCTEAINFFLYDIKAEMLFLDIAIKALNEPIIGDIKIFTLEGANQLLRYLSKHHKLAVVTKGTVKFQFEKINKAGIDTSLFSKIVVTNRDNKGIYYKQIIEELGFKPKDTIVLGDKIKTDLLPAKDLGCIAIHMKHGRGLIMQPDERVDFTIFKLSEIKSILLKTIKEREYDIN